MHCFAAVADLPAAPDASFVAAPAQATVEIIRGLAALGEVGGRASAKLRGPGPRPLPTVRAVLDDTIHNNDGRRVYARVTIERRADGLHARLTGAQGSNLLTSMELAHGLAICPEDQAERKAGETAVVQLLDWADHAALLTEELDPTTPTT